MVDVEVKLTASGAPPLNGFAEKLATGGSLLGPVPPESSPPPPPPPQLIKNKSVKSDSAFLNFRKCTIKVCLVSLIKCQ